MRTTRATIYRAVGAVVLATSIGWVAAPGGASAANNHAAALHAVNAGSVLTAPVPPPVRGLRQALADRPAQSSVRGATSTPVPPAAVPSGTWQPLGPAPIGPPYLQSGNFYAGPNSGRITGLVTIPSGALAGRVVAGSAGGGIWTSDDSGTTWTPRTDAASNLAIGSVAIDPSNANHLIAGTGEGNQSGDSFYGDGVLASTDGGNTWTLQNPGGVFTGRHIQQVAIDPSNSNHQFAATDGGLYVTTDGGTTWAKPTTPVI